MRQTMVRGLAAALVLSVTAACNAPPDMKAVRAQAQKPIQRYDNFFAAASNDKILLGAGGNILVTSSDKGASWQRQVLPGTVSIVALSHCADGSFAALDFYKKVWLGDADGRQWKARPLEADFTPLTIHCDVQNRLWIAGSFSTVLSSQDQGKTWTQQALGEDAILTAIQFFDARHGLIAGEFGSLLATEDGGAHWTKRSGLPAEFYPYAMAFANEQQGWISGLAGAVLETTDGGRSWKPQSQPAPASLYALFKVGEQVMGVGEGGVVVQLQKGQTQLVPDAPKTPSFLAAAAAAPGPAVLLAGAAGALQLMPLSAKAGAAGETPSTATH